MRETKYITIISNRKKIELNTSTILYINMMGKYAVIHVAGGGIYETRMTLDGLEKQLGEGFIKIHRGCIVAVMAIHDINDKVYLSDGECLEFTKRKKKQIFEQFKIKQKNIIGNFYEEGIPATEEEYRSYYSSFDKLPFAFTDIEMVFNEKSRAVDWIFRYGNPALARLEGVSLEHLIGNSFGSLFANMDSKWLRSYERAALYGETLELMEHSPEIDKYLKVICFPTFRGHCGCILFDISEIKLTRNSSDSEKTLMRYLQNR